MAGSDSSHEMVRELLGCPVRENGEVLGLLAVLTSPNPSAAMPRLSNSRIAAALLGIRFAKRHVSTIRSSCVREHDLEPLASIEFTHLTLPVNNSLLKRKKPIISSLLFILINRLCGVWQLEPRRRPMRQ